MKLLGISGSLRQGSLNTQLLRAAGALLPAGTTLEIFDISGIPFYNGDLDGDTKPAPVQAFIDAIAAADGLLIATPEYNYSVPGVLKNAIDWASRPAYRSVLANKPTGLLSASMSMLGGVRAQMHLKEILGGTLTPIYLTPDFLLMAAHKAFDESGKLQDEGTETRLRDYVSGLSEWIASRG